MLKIYFKTVIAGKKLMMKVLWYSVENSLQLQLVDESLVLDLPRIRKVFLPSIRFKLKISGLIAKYADH